MVSSPYSSGMLPTSLLSAAAVARTAFSDGNLLFAMQPPAEPPPTTKDGCKCKAGCKNKHCGCVKAGKSCGPACSCASLSCQNRRSRDDQQPPADAVTIEAETTSQAAARPALQWVCKECGFSSRSQQGVSVHRVACHGAEVRRAYAHGQPVSVHATEIIPAITPEPVGTLDAELLYNKYHEIMQEWAYNSEWSDRQKFDELVRVMLQDLRALSQKLWPKPVNKTIMVHRKLRLRKNAEAANSTGDSTARKTTNAAERKAKAATDKIELQQQQAQWLYKNQRKSIAQKVMNPNSARCMIEPKTLTDYYLGVFEKPNNCCLDDALYATVPIQQQQQIDDHYCDIFFPGDAEPVMKSISVDKSPGPDGVCMRVIKLVDKDCALHAFLATAIQKLQYFPKVMRLARTVLIYKDGAAGNVSNWRPITIFSMSRRIISKMIDHKLRKFITLSKPQLGFTSRPGCLINISRLSRLLRRAKKTATECHAVLLDVRKAFDSVGHKHISRALDARPMPTSLRMLCKASLLDNSTNIRSSVGQTKEIKFLAGVAQGEPLSPMLFNLAIDEVINRLNSNIVRLSYGYADEDGACSVLAFADDTTLIARSIPAMQQLLELAHSSLESIGLSLNACKTRWLAVNPPVNVAAELQLFGVTITPSPEAALVRYLGACFCPQQAFNGTDTLIAFEERLRNILDTTLLYTSQKLQIAKQYLMPVLGYSFQITPTGLITDGWLENLDKIITSFMRELLLLPYGSCNAFYYAAQAKRGLALPRYVWEARLQRLSALPTIYYSTQSPDVQSLVEEEARRCLGSVQAEMSVQNQWLMPNLTIQLRKQLRERSFSEWCAMSGAGAGVSMYAEIPACNRWLSKKFPLDQKEWLGSIKLSINACNVLSHPRVNRGVHSALCRRGCGSIETIGHVLGGCEKNNGLILDRHNAVVKCIVENMRKIGYTVYDEVRCTGDELAADGDSTVPVSRRIDIVAIDARRTKLFLLDPTVRCERDEASVQNALQEKQATYVPTLGYFREKYDIQDAEVIGLWFGARGAQHATTVGAFRRLGLLTGRSTALLDELTKIVLKHSVCIMTNHLLCNEVGV